MKKISYLLVMLTTMLAVSLSSCEKMGENDGVRGFWRLVSVKTGDVETDVTNDNIFWGLQNGIIS
ncbi:MAG: lipocalin-like domain-containing protein, partial [Alloprevotella sp.]|nr:lipocalin-like domain-containing protein [Alloprevotella sp.]